MRSTSIDAEKVIVETDGRRVILKGKVRSISERDDAEKAVWAAPGVTIVDNNLIIEEEVISF